MSDYTTVGGVANFPVKDITHKPKRMQGDMIRLKEAEMGIVNSANSTEDSNTPLSVITLERAISHYKRMSTDSTNGKLYEATAKWLEELLVTRTLKTKAVVEGEHKDEANGDTEERQQTV